MDEIILTKAYLRYFFSKWYSLTSTLLGILGYVLMFITPENNILIIVVISISFIGVIVSGYKVYRDLFMIIPKEYSLAYLPPKIGDPKIDVYQVGGSEYKFGYRGLRDNKYQLIQTNTYKETLPDLAGDFNFVIENIGYIPVDIISITCDFKVESTFNKPFDIILDFVLNSDRQPIQYPIRLAHKEQKSIILYTFIHPNSLFSNAKIAAMIRELRTLKEKLPIEIKIEMTDLNGKITYFAKDFTFSDSMLYSLCIEHWRSIGETELVRLAGE